MAEQVADPDILMVTGKRDRDELGLAVTEALDHEPGAQRQRVAELFGECILSSLRLQLLISDLPSLTFLSPPMAPVTDQNR